MNPFYVSFFMWKTPKQSKKMDNVLKSEGKRHLPVFQHCALVLCAGRKNLLFLEPATVVREGLEYFYASFLLQNKKGYNPFFKKRQPFPYNYETRKDSFPGKIHQTQNLLIKPTWFHEWLIKRAT